MIRYVELCPTFTNIDTRTVIRIPFYLHLPLYPTSFLPYPPRIGKGMGSSDFLVGPPLRPNPARVVGWRKHSPLAPFLVSEGGLEDEEIESILVYVPNRPQSSHHYLRFSLSDVPSSREEGQRTSRHLFVFSQHWWTSSHVHSLSSPMEHGSREGGVNKEGGGKKNEGRSEDENRGKRRLQFTP